MSPTQAAHGPITVPVTITVLPNKDLKYDPDPVFASKRDDIEWVCEYPFSVLVPGKKNFVKKLISGVQPGPGQMYSAKHKVDLLDDPDYYPYHVAVAKDDEKTMLVLLSASPDIIIRDR